MKRKIIFLLTFFFISSLVLDAQVPGEGNNNLPQIIPPSPDAASLGKYGEIPIGKYTGTVNIEIPIYTIDFDGLKIPISLSYHSGGIKVEELASWVGLGWSLNAGGIITNTVVGLPDHQTGNGYLKNSYDDVEEIVSLPIDDQLYIGESVKAGGIDLEPDNYSYNFAGYSGRFFIDKATNRIHTIPVSNLQFNYPSWEVIDASGFKYIFGYGETTNVENNKHSSNNTHSYTSSLVLTRIISPSGKGIVFSYQNYSSIYFTRGGQSKNIVVAQNGPADCAPSLTLNSDFCFNEVNGKRIREITWSDGKVVFHKGSNNREDIIGDYTLDSIEVFNGQNVLIKKHKLIYSFRTSSTGISSFSSTFTNLVGGKRLFLDTVKEIMNGEELSPYTFEYEDSDLPYYLSTSQDHWGYYNGQINSSLLPVVGYLNAYNGQSYSYGDANRNVNTSYAKAGALKKITYPTGGQSEFNYESNQALVDVCEYMNMYNPDVINYEEPVVIAAINDVTQLDTLNVPSALCGETKRKFIFDVYLPNTSNCPGTAKDCTGTLQVHLNNNGSAETIDLLVNPVIGNHVRGYAMLKNGNSYTLELDGTGPVIAGVTVSVTGNGNPPLIDIEGGDFVNIPVGGLRIASIVNKSFFQAPVTTYFKYYDRGNVLDTSTTNQKSSGRVCGVPKYYFETMNSCGTGSSGLIFRRFITLFSTSLVGLNSEDGKGVGYKMVEEIKEADGVKIKSINTFTSHDEYPDYTYNTYPFMRDFSNDYKRGMPLNDYKLKFNSATQSYSLLNETKNIYTVSEQQVKKINGLRYACNNYGGESAEFLYPACTEDIFKLYRSYSKRFYLSTTTEKNYPTSDTTKFIQKNSNYFYSDSTHMQMTRMDVINSKGDTIRTDFKYPQDYSTTAPYLQMISRHIISPVIENTQTNITQNKEIARTKTNYQFWHSDSLILPGTIQKSIAGNTLVTEISFNYYDTSANIIQYTARDGVIHSYIWDYKLEYPIAECINAASASIAATSFEADGKGGWSYSGSASLHPSAPTGTKGYSLLGGNITRSGLLSGNTYMITYWKKDSTSTVTVNGGSGTLIAARNGWKLYSHEITGSTTLTISGTAYIDELRMHPKGSFMTTTVYKPLAGIITQCNANNNILRYEYDSFNRLKLIRADDGKIIKQIDYQFKVYTHTNAVWEATGVFRCKPCPANSTYFSNIRQQEERDVNTLSATTNQLRWTDIGITGDCNPSTDWQNTATAIRCKKNAQNQNTGEQEQEQKDLNPCSSTYNQTRWVVTGTNITACPLPGIYAKTFVTDIYNDFEATTATILIKFFSDAACTMPVSVNNLIVNYKEVRRNCGGGGTALTNNYYETCFGTQTSLGTQIINWDDGIHCWEYTFSVTAGTGYQLGN